MLSWISVQSFRDNCALTSVSTLQAAMNVPVTTDSLSSPTEELAAKTVGVQLTTRQCFNHRYLRPSHLKIQDGPKMAYAALSRRAKNGRLKWEGPRYICNELWSIDGCSVLFKVIFTCLATRRLTWNRICLNFSAVSTYDHGWHWLSCCMKAKSLEIGFLEQLGI